MKKLGLRAVAGGLALLLTASAFAPAATANAADMLVTAKAPKTLVITADMVDDDGEIVISGEKWDRIIVEKEAAAKDIYFDGVEVGELVVESGSKSNVQLWDVAAEALTVKEPELVELDMAEVRKLLSNKDTRTQAMELYMKVQAENKKALSQAPSIVTMAKAVVDTVTASGSASLDLNKGEVKTFNLEASTKVSQVNVTLKGYDGEVTYKGGEKFNIVNFKTVDCNLEKLTVDSSASNNYLNVSSKASTVANVEVAGNAAVSLNIPTTKLEIAESATAAQVGVLGEVAEMNIAADNAKVNVGASAKVEAATVTGDKANIGGQGKLENVEISGTGAYVSTSGSSVKGENTYKPPVYVEPTKPEVEFGKLPEGSKVFLPANTTMGGYGHSKEVGEDGSVAVTFDGQYQEIQFNLPSEVDLSVYDKMVVTLESPSAGDENKVVFKVITTGAELDEYKNPKPIKEAWGVVKYPGGDVEVDLSGFDGKKVCRFTLMANNGPCNATVYRIAFIPKAGVTPPAEDEPVVPVKPSELSADWEVYTPADLTKGGYGYKETPAQYGGENVAISGQYQEIQYKFAQDLDLSKYEKMLLTFSTKSAVAADYVVIKLVDKDAEIDEYKNPIPMLTKWDCATDNTANVEIDLADYADEKLSWVTFMAKNGATEMTFYRVALLPKKGAEDNTTPTPTPKPDPDPEPEVTFAIVDPGKTELTVGDAVTLQVTTTVSGSAIKWTSNNTAVATVSDKGVVTAVSAVSGGAVTITATMDKYSDSVKFTVVEKKAEPTPTPTVPEEPTVPGGSTSQPEEPTAPEGGILCTPDKTNLVEFKDVDFKNLVGKKVNVTVDVIRVGGTENPKAHGQFNDSVRAGDSDWFYAINYNKEIGDTWTTFGKTEFVVPEQFADETNPVYFAIKVASGVDYSQYKIYYKNFKVEEVKAEESKEFYLVKDGTFTNKIVGDSNSVNVADCYLNPWTDGEYSGHNFVDKLPESMKADKAVADKFRTLEGILEMVDYFEVEVTLTEWEAVAGKEDYAPQAQVYLQYFGTGNNDGCGTWGKCLGDMKGTPKTGVFKHSLSHCADWTAPELSKLGIEMVNAKAGATLAGSYSVKVVLR